MSECDKFSCSIENDLGAATPQYDISRSGLFTWLCYAIIEGLCQVVQGVNPAVRSPRYQPHNEMSIVRFFQSSLRHRVPNLLVSKTS